ncbi:MAG: CPBP family intramembrane metalloprotease [Bacteroidales bacterium]|nr:CPBP family intramembrane metalloprotease [Bacteroidales bacterium]
MPYLNFSTAKPAMKFLIIIFTIVTSGIIVSFAGLLLARIIFWMPLEEVNHVLYNRTGMLTDLQLKYFQLVQSLGFFVVPGFILYWLFSSETETYFDASFRLKAIQIILLTALFFVAIPLINMLIEYNQQIKFPGFLNGAETRLREMEGNYGELTKRLVSTGSFGHFLFNILLIAVLPAIGEELIFRGVLQKVFYEISNNIHLSVLITAIIFSAVHGQFFEFVPRFLLGVFFGYLMVWGRNIWLPVAAHFINNLLAVTAFFLYNRQILDISPEKMAMGNTHNYTWAISALFSVILIVVIRKTSLKLSVNN